METRNGKHAGRLDDDVSLPLPGTLTDEELKLRSELAAALRPSAFPAECHQLRRIAGEEQASPEILELLDRLPIDTRFDTVQDVWETLGGHRETRERPAPAPMGVRPTVPRPADRPRQPKRPWTIALGVAAEGLDVGVSVVLGVARVARRVARGAEVAMRGRSRQA